MTTENVRADIAAVEAAAFVLADATSLETRLADERALVKDAGIARLRASGVANSVTAAEKVIELDAEFMAHRESERAAVAARIVAQGKFEAAKLRAQFAVEQWSTTSVDAPDEDDEEEAGTGHVCAANEVLDDLQDQLDAAGVPSEDARGELLGFVDRVAIVLKALKPKAVE